MQSNNKNIIFIVLIIIIVAMLALLWGTKEKKPFSWKPSYSYNDKNPYGTYILFEQLESIFPNKKIEKTQFTVYENYHRMEDDDFNYIFVDFEFNPPRTDSEALLDFIYYGGYLFVSAERFGELITDSLKVEVDSRYLFKNDDSLGLNFTDKKLKAKYNYIYKKGKVNTYFSKYPEDAKILARNSKDEVVLLSLDYGDGKIVLSSTPNAFTNYNMLLDSNNEFVAKSLSYLPLRDTFWDEYYKLGREIEGNPYIAPISFIWGQRAFRSAIILALITIVVFVIFEARRKQRIIPIIEPLKNTTLEFVEVIGRLYFLKRNHHDIALKKINYFLDYIRINFFLKTYKFDDEFIEKLAVKSGNDKKRVRQLFKLIQHIQSKNNLTEQQLLELNFRIDKFKKNSKLQSKKMLNL